MKRLSIVTVFILLAIVAIPVYAPSVRIPTTTTIPPIPAESAGVQLQCSPLQAFPGSVVSNSSGFIRIRCPDRMGAVQFGIKGAPNVTLTPSFILGTGYVNASIILANSGGSPCNFNFGHLTVGNVTVMTGTMLSGPITFGNPPTSSTQLLATTYDYCLQYARAPSTTLAGFDIVWT